MAGASQSALEPIVCTRAPACYLLTPVVAVLGAKVLSKKAWRLINMMFCKVYYICRLPNWASHGWYVSGIYTICPLAYYVYRNKFNKISNIILLLRHAHFSAQQENELNVYTSPSAYRHQVMPNCQHLRSSLSYSSTATSFQNVSL